MGEPLTYRTYLRIDDLLGCQVPRSEGPVHDEMLFIVAHQAYELWFKLLAHELRGACGAMTRGDAIEACRLLERILRIVRLLAEEVPVIESMRPADFLRFRELLKPASGLQSAGFREVEFLLGREDDAALRFLGEGDPARSRLKATLRWTNLWRAFVALAERADPACAMESGRSAFLRRLYERCEPAPLYETAERLVDLDERVWLWRCHHARMAERMIGGKPGTAASIDPKYGAMGQNGVRYLDGTLSRRLYPELWAVRSALGAPGDGTAR
ncbi:MAG: tryptophan 2,3-dioxygenase [Planctomycetes bacterium]|nr:tryptophan 2,3-dioxygenase [Planctomycetota bacterium]